MLRAMDLRAVTKHSTSHVDALRHTGNIVRERRHGSRVGHPACAVLQLARLTRAK
jgi:hypothetical protein